mmetsp:Transcript_4287/g.5861  ORF Transcript_4287/g.5861 Transcript_4287/m.5861 type:complete len:273 (-) Transcript_4287:366-1184(-)|eukprot:CAMPEP_0185731258 /NCGR_PEP_ID=MMETSP1171-20130828/12361_1 /TAXON_ID=374046 /ORGANISM="Helicotheca tamensis, Strain CCMP826" /LENGTH=272 /DNA_ID=CAMNT_0028400487 /DNA_START=124 /DNA_END=942 /DNA_ORIENTATION=-
MTILKHYSKHSATSYESAFFYSSNIYLQHLTTLVHNHFGWSTTTTASHLTLLDIGGGTGSFTKRIIDGFPSITAIVLEPFLEPAHNLNLQNLSFYQAAADAFLTPIQPTSSDMPRWRSGYHHVLMKEMVHHLPEEQRTAIFQGIRSGFQRCPQHDNAPALLIITRPKEDIDYPIWPAAKQIWAQNQPAHDEIMQDLKEAGFNRVLCRTHGYACRIELSQWKSMVQGRCWSTFSSFTDEELREACEAMDEQYTIDEKGQISFEDRLIFISAYL